jgi:hypothetical protein
MILHANLAVRMTIMVFLKIIVRVNILRLRLFLIIILALFRNYVVCGMYRVQEGYIVISVTLPLLAVRAVGFWYFDITERSRNRQLDQMDSAATIITITVIGITNERITV